MASENLFFTDTTANLGISGVFTGASRDVGVNAPGQLTTFTKFRAYAFADVAGTLRVEASVDNTNWRRASAGVAVAAAGSGAVSVDVVARYYRVVYTNGATGQATFLLTSGFSSV